MNRKPRIRKPKPTAHGQRPDVPYTMRLPDGRTVFVLVPGKWTRGDVSGEAGFTPDGVRFLDRIRALAIKDPSAPTPGYIVAVREALNLTQVQLAGKLGVDSMTVSRWERGAIRPGADSLKALEKLKTAAARKGITIEAA